MRTIKELEKIINEKVNYAFVLEKDKKGYYIFNLEDKTYKHFATIELLESFLELN